MHHAPVVAEDFCQSVEFDTPATQNHQILHDISCLDIFQPGLMQNLRTGFEKPLNLRAKTGLVVAQRAGRELGPIYRTDGSPLRCPLNLTILEWLTFSNGLTWLSLVCPLLLLLRDRMQRVAIFFPGNFNWYSIFPVYWYLCFVLCIFFTPAPGSCVMYFYIMHVPCCGHLGFKTCADIQASVAPTSTLTASKPASIVQTGAYEPHPSSVPNVSQTKKNPSLATRERRKRNQKWKKPAAADKWRQWCCQRGAKELA